MKKDKFVSMFSLKIFGVHVIYPVIILFIFIGCAPLPTKSFSISFVQDGRFTDWPDRQCEDRFREYWSNRFSGSIEDGYHIESPHFREVVSLGKYKNYVQNAAKNKLLHMEISRIQRLSEFMITIDCLATIQAGNSEPVEVSIMDRWVLTGGKWYHIIKDPLIFTL